MKSENLNITIVGLGLIGGSYAKALRKFIKPNKIWAIDKSEESLKEAKELGVIDEGFNVDDSVNLKSDFNKGSFKKVLKESDIIIMCLYPQDTVRFLKENNESLKKESIITDVVGVKGWVIEEVNSFIKKDVDFIAGHPMAGNEFRGFHFSDEELFKDSEYILIPTTKNKAKNLDIIQDIISKIGFRNIRIMDSKEHDKTIAFTSHLPHLIAISLANSKNLEEEVACIGRSFKGATRVANLNFDLWSQLFLSNSKNLIEELDMFREDIEFFRELLVNKDLDGLKEVIKKANIRREEINK